MKILISGIGGVGGYFGGRIAKNLLPENQIYLYAKPQAAKAIEANGLCVHAEKEQFTVQPNKVSSNPKDFGLVDLILFCTKSYDLQTNLEELQVCIHKQTCLLPLLNGIDNEQIIRNQYPNNPVWNGFCFVFAWKTDLHTIQEVGNQAKLFFGKTTKATPRMLEFNQQLKQANIQPGLCQDIVERQWQKFYFISTLATIGSCYQINVGEILNNPTYYAQYLQLLDEFLHFANHTFAKNHIDCRMDESHKQKIIENLQKTSPESTTSMQRDFLQNKPTELESLTGIIANSGLDLKLYKKMYKTLKTKKA